MEEEATSMTIEKETEKEEGGKDVKQLEGDEDKKEEAPAEEEIAITYKENTIFKQPHYCRHRPD